MNYRIYSYRFSQEIIQHPNYRHAWNEIEKAISGLPVFRYPNKSKVKPSLDVSQQMLNTYFDRVLAIENRWNFHPHATQIEGSELRADFLKGFGDLSIQVEVQFGNIARWYSDIFKFQTAYSQGLINMGLSIVPVYDLAIRIDQNIVNFERTFRELPYAKLSITLPILLIGVYPDERTKIIDLSRSGFDSQSDITANTNNARENRFRIVNAYLNDVPIESVGPQSPVGPLPE